MRRPLFVALLATLPLCGQTAADCRTVFVTAMPDAIDRHAAARLGRIGLSVAADRDRADCLLVFSRSATLRPDRDASAPADPPVIAGDVQELYAQVIERARAAGGSGERPVKVAAFGLVHRETRRLLWSGSATCDAERPPSPKALAARLLNELRKEVRRPRR
jgi:putative heme iron utilization protein